MNSYELYISKLNPGIDPLFQTPKKVYDTNGCWFKCEPLGKNVITKTMPTLSRKAGLSQVYTNHCVRASTVTALHKAGIEGRRICQLTKHKNESSLAHNVSGSRAQKGESSEILSGSLIGGQPHSSSTLVRHQNSTITNSAAANSAHQEMSTLFSPNASVHMGTLNICNYSLPSASVATHTESTSSQSTNWLGQN